MTSDEYSGWLTFDPSTSTIDQFLQQYAPSCTPATRCAWISVRNPQSELPTEGLRAGEASRAWLQMPKEQCTQETLDMLAHQYDILSGKWMVFVYPQNVDEVWSKLARAVLQGELGTAAKVSPAGAQGPTHLICVYTENFTDEMDVLRVREKLTALGFQAKLYYKPDLYTYCDIYAKNRWKIPASRYAL